MYVDSPLTRTQANGKQKPKNKKSQHFPVAWELLAWVPLMESILYFQKHYQTLARIKVVINSETNRDFFGLFLCLKSLEQKKKSSIGFSWTLNSTFQRFCWHALRYSLIIMASRNLCVDSRKSHWFRLGGKCGYIYLRADKLERMHLYEKLSWTVLIWTSTKFKANLSCFSVT